MAARRKIVALAGGVGAARFLDGLARITDPKMIYVIGNTGDDTELHGLSISPDLDTVTYTLGGIADRKRGWGIKGDTFRCLEGLARLDAETWFQLGDRDLATHIFRTELLRRGATLSQATSVIATRYGVRAAIVPMSDDRVRTIVHTRRGQLDFQNWFVRRRASDAVTGLHFDGATAARPAPGVLEAIRHASGIVLCPSNPFISIGPILAVPGIRDALRQTSAPVIAISPIVGGKALKGPADRMMKSMGMRPAARGVAELYRDFVNVFLVDCQDAGDAAFIESSGIRAVITDTVMTGVLKKKALARTVLKALEQ